MIFSSISFIFYFLPFVLLIYFITPQRFRNFVLVCFSLLFYTWGEGGYLGLMLFVIFFNWGAARLLEPRSKLSERRLLLAVILLVNFGLLGYFKYAGFLVENLNTLLTSLTISPLPIPAVRLPIGVSFFIFEAVAYIIDVYRREVPASGSPLKVALYIALFPHLIAGPIVRYSDIGSQIDQREITRSKFSYGIQRFILGLGKKLLIANNLALVADRIFAVATPELGTDLAWLGAIAYTLQIYFDFSGYSDMAIGLSAMFGFTINENFNQPYQARSLRDFWQRWHISLSTWFRDYLYIPLGGSRVDPVRTYINLMIVFFVTGLWHGASWTFVFWGLWHGVFLVIERLGLNRLLTRLPAPAQHLYTLLIVMIGWVFFRAATLPEALRYLQVMFSWQPRPNYQAIQFFVSNEAWIAFLFGILFCLPLNQLFRWPSTSSSGHQLVQFARLAVLVIVFGLCLLSLSSSAYNPFIYFRF